MERAIGANASTTDPVMELPTELRQYGQEWIDSVGKTAQPPAPHKQAANTILNKMSPDQQSTFNGWLAKLNGDPGSRPGGSSGPAP